MTRRNLTERENALNRMRKTALETARTKVETAEKNGSTPEGTLKTYDDALAGRLGAETQQQVEASVLGQLDNPYHQARQLVQAQRGTGGFEAMQAAQELGVRLDPFDAPRLAEAIQPQIVAGMHGRQALIRALGGIGDGSVLLDSSATEDEISDAMSNPGPLDERPETVLEQKHDYDNMDASEADAEMTRQFGSPPQQAHQASLDRAAAAATPEAKLLREAGAGPPVDPTDYDSMSAEQLDELMMKESGQTDPRSGRYETNVPGVTVSVHD